jgi:hypothetical protein
MPEAFHWIVTSPPEGVNGTPVMPVLKYARFGESPTTVTF